MRLRAAGAAVLTIAAASCGLVTGVGDLTVDPAASSDAANGSELDTPSDAAGSYNGEGGGVIEAGGDAATDRDTSVPLVCSTDGPRYGTTVTAGASWTLPENARLPDGLVATAMGLTPLTVSHYGFALPANAIVTGITVSITRRGDGGSTKDGAVSLPQGASKSDPAPWSDAFTTKMYGSSTDLWGSTWTPNNLNQPSFSVTLTTVTGADIGRVDSIGVTVRYCR